MGKLLTCRFDTSPAVVPVTEPEPAPRLVKVTEESGFPLEDDEEQDAPEEAGKPHMDLCFFNGKVCWEKFKLLMFLSICTQGPMHDILQRLSIATCWLDGGG